MAKKKKGIYFNEFMSRGYDSNTLVQDYKGIVLLPIAGHVYVVRTFFGFYRIVHDEKKNANSKIKHSLALKFRMPFSQVRLIKNVPTVEKMVINDSIITKDGINAIPAPGGFDFKYEVVDNKDNYKNLYNLNGDAMKGVKSSIKQIISFIINRGTLDKVRVTFNIDFSKDKDHGRWPEWIEGTDKDLLDSMYDKIEEQYGIKVTEISAVDFNEPTRIVEANEELKAANTKAEAADIERETKRKDSELEIEIEKKKIDTRVNEAERLSDVEIQKQKAIAINKLEVLFEKTRDKNYSDEQLARLIGLVLNPNATRIELGDAAAILKEIKSIKDVHSTQAQQVSTQAQQASVQAQQAPVQAQSVVSQTKDTRQKKAAKAVRVYAKRSNVKTDKKNGVKGNVPTPRKHSHNQQSNGHGMNRR